MSISKQHITILFSGIVLMMGCSPTEATQKSSDRDNSAIEIKNTDITLADHLSKLSGITVYGSGSDVKVNIRGAASFGADTAPLFVVNGQELGRSYAHVANQVPVSDIKSINVVKGAEAASYGFEGGNGVIEITTKGN